MCIRDSYNCAQRGRTVQRTLRSILCCDLRVLLHVLLRTMLPRMQCCVQ